MIILVTAKCNKCGGSATGSTFEEAREKLDHAPALSRGIHCGDNYNAVVQVKDEGYHKVDGKSSAKVIVDESKTVKTKNS